MSHWWDYRVYQTSNIFILYSKDNRIMKVSRKEDWMKDSNHGNVCLHFYLFLSRIVTTQRTRYVVLLLSWYPEDMVSWKQSGKPRRLECINGIWDSFSRKRKPHSKVKGNEIKCPQDMSHSCLQEYTWNVSRVYSSTSISSLVSTEETQDWNTRDKIKWCHAKMMTNKSHVIIIFFLCQSRVRKRWSLNLHFRVDQREIS